jgi:hypothetical protein
MRLYDLPVELLRHIYEYDDTYMQKFKYIILVRSPKSLLSLQNAVLNRWMRRLQTNISKWKRSKSGIVCRYLHYYLSVETIRNILNFLIYCDYCVSEIKIMQIEKKYEIAEDNICIIITFALHDTGGNPKTRLVKIITNPNANLFGDECNFWIKERTVYDGFIQNVWCSWNSMYSDTDTALLFPI